MVSVPLLPLAVAIAALPPAILTVLVWQERTKPGATTYGAMLAATVVFDLLYALSMVVTDRSVHRVLISLLATLVLVVSVVWVLFTLEYTGRIRFVTARLVAVLLAVPTLALASLLWFPESELLLREYTLVRRAGVVVSYIELGWVGIVFALLGFLALLVGVLVLLGFVVSDRHRYGHQTAVLVVVVALPAVTTLSRVFELSPLGPFNLTPFTWAVGAPIVGYGLLRWDLFGFAPATLRIGHAAAIDDLGDAVLIVEGDFRIVDANARAVRLFGRPAEDLVQLPVAAVVDEPIDTDAGRSVRLETDRGHRDFDVSISPIDGPRGRTIGHTMVFHDVTDEKQRRQRFEVLNRILRHNLRNSMNSIVGYSQELGSHVDGSAEWMIDRIEAQSNELVALSEKAREIDRVTSPSRPSTKFSVRAALARVRDRLVEDDGDVAVTVYAPESLELTSNEVVFEAVVRYAARSLVSHSGTDDPRLVLSAVPTDGRRPWISCTITSNGDPIPEDERLVIERGEETPLDHSDDLDLWLVSWGVDTLGGDLSFVDDEDRPGLQFSIPDVRPDADGSGPRPP